MAAELILDVLVGTGADAEDVAEEQRYRIALYARGEDPSYGEASLTWTDEPWARLAEIKEAGTQPRWRAEVGLALRKLLKQADVDDGPLRERIRDGEAIYLTLRSDARRAYSLPWELLKLKGMEDSAPIGLRPNVWLRYAWPETQTTPPAPSVREEGSRILFAWSEPRGSVPHEAHRVALTDALEGCGLTLPDGDQLEQASLKRLRERLEGAVHAGNPYRVLHLLAHGGNLPDRGGVGLVLDGPYGPEVVAPDRLASVLGPYADTLRLVVLCACSGGEGGDPSTPVGGIARALHQEGFERVIASRFLWSKDGSIRFAHTFYDKLYREPASVERSFAAARTDLLTGTALDAASLQLFARRRDGWDCRPLTIRPYRGLATYGRADRRFFFGRSAETAKVIERVRDARSGGTGNAGWPRRTQFLVGASGSGKSSLLSAGVLPTLETEGWTACAIEVEAAAESTLPPGRPLLVVLDQLERLFTRLTPEKANQVAQQIWNWSCEGDVVVLGALRADYLHRLGEITVQGISMDRPAFDGAHTYFLPAIRRDELAEIVRQPAHKAGVRLEAGLEEVVLDQAGATRGAGVLPLLSVLLDELWRQRREPADGYDERLLTHEALKDLGGLGGVLAQRANSLLQSLAADDLGVLRRALTRLVLSDDAGSGLARARVLEEDLGGEAARAVIDRMVDAQLAVRGGETTAWVELSHDAVLDAWPSLREWVASDREQERRRRQLRERAKEWRTCVLTGRPVDHLLLTGPALREARRLTRGEAESGATREFLEASADPRRRVLDDLEEEGWGVVVPEGEAGRRMLDAIRTLVDWRQDQLNRPVSVFTAPSTRDRSVIARWWRDTYQQGSASESRAKYLLLLGDFDALSVELQQHAQAELRVGRLCCDTLEELTIYANKVVRNESTPSDSAERALGVYAVGESAAVRVGRTLLGQPLAAKIRAAEGERVRVALVEDESGLDPLLRGDGRGQVIVNLGFGLSSRGTDPVELRQRQGALVLGDRARTVLDASSVPATRFHDGSFWLTFSNFSAGTPTPLPSVASSRYCEALGVPMPRLPIQPVADSWPHGFVAQLPRRLLGHPEGPTGFLGLVDLGWTTAFQQRQSEGAPVESNQPFVDAVRVVLLGGRYGAASAVLHLEARKSLELLWESHLSGLDTRPDIGSHQTRALADQELRRVTLQSFLLLGDPATHLPRLASAAAPTTVTVAS